MQYNIFGLDQCCIFFQREGHSQNFDIRTYIRCTYRLLYLLIIYITWNLCHFDVPISTKCPRKCKGQRCSIRSLPTQIQIYCRRSKNVNINCKHMITKIRREILQCCPELVPQISGILCPVFVVIVS